MSNVTIGHTIARLGTAKIRAMTIYGGVQLSRKRTRFVPKSF